jgi:MFS family permease
MTESIAIQESLPPERPKRPSGVGDEAEEPSWPHSIRYLVQLCAFLTSLSFGVTQVPLLYVFRLMTCDAYYKHHPSPSSASPSLQGPHLLNILAYTFSSNNNNENTPDRCSIHPIESSTALSVSLLGASTTVFGLLNLFLTGSLIKRIGIKPTLVIQVFFPALRLLVQNIGVEVWGSTGIIIIQCSQIVSIVGGPSGYLLVLNTFITEVVEYEGRTAALGRLTGAMMFGSAIGFLLGGVVAEAFGIKAPFRLTFILFLSACAYVALFLPHIPPASKEMVERESGKGRKSKKKGARRFLGPLAVFAPRKFIGRDGVVRTEYGAFLLAWGVFLGILATGTFTICMTFSLLPSLSPFFFGLRYYFLILL